MLAAGAPQLDDRINTTAEFPDDGLSHFVLTPRASAPSTASDEVGAESEPDADSARPVRDGVPRLTITPEQLISAPAGVQIERRDGIVGFINRGGEFVSLEDDLEDDADPDVAVTEDGPRTSFGHPDIDALAADPAVESITAIGDGTFGVSVTDPDAIDPDRFVIEDDTPFGFSSEPYENYQWGLENNGTNLRRVTGETQVPDADVDAVDAATAATGSGVVVAVIDSGVDFSHPDLANSSWSNPGETCGNGVDDDANGYVDDCVGWDFGHGDASPYNDGTDAHGTHVAGIITANRNNRGVAGIAPNAKVMDLNVNRQSGGQTSISGSHLAAAIRYAVDNGADIINLSLATSPGASAASVRPVIQAIDHAAANDVLVVVAAGNNGIDLTTTSVYPASYASSNMLVVGASTSADARASFSNHGADVIDVFAPGETILSTAPDDDYLFFSGTSQASPFTAGAAALVLEANPNAGVAGVIAQIAGRVDVDASFDTAASGGRLNAAAALGVEGDEPRPEIEPTGLDVSIAGLDAAADTTGNAGAVAASVTVTMPLDHFSENFAWEFSVLTRTDAGVYAVLDHPLTIDGSNRSTGADGTAELGTGAGSFDLTTSLPNGTYTFIIEAVPTADSSVRLGDAFLATFVVGANPDPEPMDGADPSGDGDSSGDGDLSGDGDPSGDRGPAEATTPSDSTDPSDPVASTDRASGTSPDQGPASGDVGTVEIGQQPEGSTSGGNDTVTGNDTGPISDAGPGNGVVEDDGATSADGAASTNGGSSGPTDGSDPATPSTAAPTQPGTGPDEATSGSWSVTSMSSQAGFVNMANTLTLRGSFPDDVYVWFGDQPGEVVSASSTSLTVRTPLRATPGLVDVTLRRSGSGVVLTMPAAYAFLDTSGGSIDAPTQSPAPPPAPAPTPTPTPAPGDSNGSDSNDGGSNDSVVDGRGSNETGSDSTSGDTGTSRRSRLVRGEPTALGNGLTGAPITGGDPTIGVATCTASPCPVVRR